MSHEQSKSGEMVSTSRKQQQYEALLSRGVEPEKASKLSGYESPEKPWLPSAPLPLWTHDELMQFARISGIRNAKSLSRDELIDLLGSELPSENVTESTKESTE